MVELGRIFFASFQLRIATKQESKNVANGIKENNEIITPIIRIKLLIIQIIQWNQRKPNQNTNN
jgi:hypothetical protein